jgi:hypothetical protein
MARLLLLFILPACGLSISGKVVATSEARSPREVRVAALRTESRSSKVVVSASVAKADFMQLGADLTAAVGGGADWLHFSVQDGRMVPKISFGSPVVASLRPHFPDTVFDVKLGVIEPEHRVAEFVKAGADIISVHPEATLQLAAVLHAIHSAGCAPGVILNPATSLATVEVRCDPSPPPRAHRSRLLSHVPSSSPRPHRSTCCLWSTWWW